MLDPFWPKAAGGIGLYLAYTVPTAGLLTTTQKTSWIRRIWVPCVLYLLFEFCMRMRSLTSSRFINGVVTGEATVAALQCLNLLVIKNLDEGDLIRGKLYDSSTSLDSRLLQTWCLLLNFRAIGTAWQVKNVPEHPKYYLHRLTRVRYVLRESAIIAWQYLLLDIIYMSMKDATPEDTARLFGPGLEFRYFDATFEQQMARISVGIVSWLLPARVCLDIVSRLYFVLLVILGIASPETCRPVFGRLWDAYTIRGFWGKFWHQFFRWPLTSMGSYIARDVLRLPRPSLVERYSNIFFTFLTSGVLHVYCDAILDVPPSESRAIMFFCSFPLGIMIEDGVQEIWQQISGREENDKVPWWHRAIGFAWVAAWMCVTSPWYLYPAARQQSDNKWMVPFSVVEAIGLDTVQKILLGYGAMLWWVIGGEI